MTPPNGVETALGDYRRRAIRALIGGAAASAVGIAVGNDDVSAPLIVFGVMAVTMGLVGIVRVLRIRRLADRGGWRTRDAAFRVAEGRGNGQPALVLRQSHTEEEAVLSISTTVWRWDALEGSRHVWVTGNPKSRFAAVAPQDMRAIVVVKRPLMRWWERRLKRIALGDSEPRRARS